MAKGASGNLSAVVPIAGTGLLAEYFKGKNFEELRSVKVAPEAGFDLGDYSPDPDWLPIDNFSARWSGKVEAPATGVHTFHVTGDDGIRLWVNGQLIVNGWIDQGPTGYSGTINLTAGQKYDIKLEYFESAGGALCRLEWTPPGQPRQVVAKRYLSPAAPGSHGLARGIGLKGEYFSGATKVLERVDAEINWPGLMPWPPLGVPQDNFSVRWTGQLRTIEAGAYLFRAAMDDGMRMRINGQIVLEDWASGGLRPVSGTINLAADTLYDVEVEYYDGTNDHACRIEWERPGSGKSELLPTTRLYPGADSYALVADGIYEIEPVLATGKRLDVAGISAANGASVVLWDDFSSANQRWKAVSVAGNLWEFEPQHAPGKRLDVAGGGSANGTTVHSWDTNSSSAQRWKLINPSGGSFELEPQCAPGKRLGVTGGSSSNGATVQTQDPNGSTAQRWRFLQQ